MAEWEPYVQSTIIGFIFSFRHGNQRLVPTTTVTATMIGKEWRVRNWMKRLVLLRRLWRASVKVSNDVHLQLYALYKIATEGPCSAPQPSAIKMTARAKWQAWQKLGAMSPEEAMLRYLEIVTELYPNWAAVDRGHLDITEILVTRKADINAKDNEGQNPLHYAAVCERESIAKFLVKENADPDIKDDDDNYPRDLCELNWPWLKPAMTE